MGMLYILPYWVSYWNERPSLKWRAVLVARAVPRLEFTSRHVGSGSARRGGSGAPTPWWGRRRTAGGAAGAASAATTRRCWGHRCCRTRRRGLWLIVNRRLMSPWIGQIVWVVAGGAHIGDNDKCDRLNYVQNPSHQCVSRKTFKNVVKVWFTSLIVKNRIMYFSNL